jgi:hypothetical protein
MASFAENLRTYLINAGFGSNIYAESFPAPTSITPQIVGIISAGEIINSGNPELISFTKRIIVTGSSTTAFQKAEEILEYLWPRTQKPTWLQETGFILPNYNVKKVFCEKMPSLVKNVGNIFYADFVVRFLTAQ